MLVELVELVGLYELLGGTAAVGGAAAAARRLRARKLRAHAARQPGRTAAQIRGHYVIERELAERLRRAPREARAALYPQVYDELFRRVPHHPQLARQRDPAERARRARKIGQQLRFLKRFLGPRTRFMEVGAGDCALSLRAAAHAKQVYAVEVSRQLTKDVAAPGNLALVLTDGPSVPLPDGSVDFAFSDQLMEHLHPEDAAEQVRDIQRVLASGGRYFCITPNRLYGPWDISSHFDEQATGLHLKEYSNGELRRLFLECGFREVRFYAGARGYFVRVPYALIAAMEGLLERLPHRWRRLGDFGAVRALLGVRAMAVK